MLETELYATDILGKPTPNLRKKSKQLDKKSKTAKMVRVLKKSTKSSIKPNRNIITRYVTRDRISKPLTSDALSYLNFVRNSQRVTLGKSNFAMQKLSKSGPRLMQKLTTKTKSKSKICPPKKRVILKSILKTRNTSELVEDAEHDFSKAAVKLEFALNSQAELLRNKGGSEQVARSKLTKHLAKETPKKVRLHPAARLMSAAVASTSTASKPVVKKNDKKVVKKKEKSVKKKTEKPTKKKAPSKTK